MSRDHFVPVTYLKRFGDPHHRGRLHVYRKRDGKHVIQRPQNVCVERRGDMNPYFPSDPRIVRKFLRLIEPSWNQSVDGLIKNPFDLDARFIIAGLMAYLSTWTPTARRTFTKIMVNTLESTRPYLAKAAMNEISDQHEAEKTAEALLSPDIRIMVDPDYPRAMALQNCVCVQANLYQAKWMVLKNETDQPFLTSDYPACKKFESDTDMFGIFYFPLTPQWAVLVGVNPEKYDRKPDLRKLRVGETSSGVINPEAVPDLNELIVKSAEDHIICNGQFDWVAELVETFKDWRLEALIDSFSTHDGTLQMFRLRPAVRS